MSLTYHRSKRVRHPKTENNRLNLTATVKLSHPTQGKVKLTLPVKFLTPRARKIVKCPRFARGDIEVPI